MYQRGPTERAEISALVGKAAELVAQAVVERRTRRLGEQGLAVLDPTQSFRFETGK